MRSDHLQRLQELNEVACGLLVRRTVTLPRGGTTTIVARDNVEADILEQRVRGLALQGMLNNKNAKRVSR